jgi:hypothetical protein
MKQWKAGLGCRRRVRVVDWTLVHCEHLASLIVRSGDFSETADSPTSHQQNERHPLVMTFKAPSSG